MTEADARVMLRDCGGFGGLEAWIAGRRWRAVPGGWNVTLNCDWSNSALALQRKHSQCGKNTETA
jgi:hypothetical protein